MSDTENDSFKMDDSDNESESDNGLKRFMDEKDKEVAVKKVVNEVFSFSNGNNDNVNNSKTEENKDRPKDSSNEKNLLEEEEQKINDNNLPFVAKFENLSENLLFNKGNDTIPMPMGIEIQPIKINYIDVSKIENITYDEILKKKRNRQNEDDKNKNSKKEVCFDIKISHRFIKQKIFLIQKIKVQENLKPIIFQYIINTIKQFPMEEKENSKEYYEKNSDLFKEKMNLKLSVALKSDINKSMLAMIYEMEKNEKSTPLTPSIYINNLIKMNNKKEPLCEDDIKNIFLIIKILIEKNKIVKKDENIIDKKILLKYNINSDEVNINLNKNFDAIEDYDNLLNDDSDFLNYSKSNIIGNKEEFNNLPEIFFKETNSISKEIHIENNTINNYAEKIIEIQFRKGHLINRAKNIINKQFEIDFNQSNDTYKISIKLVNKKENDNKNENKDYKKINKNINKNKEEKENLDKRIEIIINMENNNNSDIDHKFMYSSFEKMLEEAKKQQNLSYLKESENVKELIKKEKHIYLEEILSDKIKGKKICEEDRTDQEEICKNEKCRMVSKLIFRTKNMDGLIKLLKCGYIRPNSNSIEFRNKTKFEEEIKKLKGFEDFTLELNIIDNIRIQLHMLEIKQLAKNPSNYLAKSKKKLIKSKVKNKKNEFI